MSEKTKEVPQGADLTYAHTLVIKSTHEYKVHGPYGTIGARGPPLGFRWSGAKSTDGDPRGRGPKQLQTTENLKWRPWSLWRVGG